MLDAILVAGSLYGAYGTPVLGTPVLSGRTRGERAVAVAVAGRRSAAQPTIRPGDKGAAVTRLQRRLHQLGYAPGAVNGGYGERTRAAVWAFQKVNRIHPDSTVGRRTWAALARPRTPRALVPRRKADRVEIDLRRQLLFIYRNRRLVLISHVSTGAPGMATPVGDYRVYRRIGSWHQSPLGGMYRPLFFHRGYAMHGSLSVPLHPASHGCVRLPLNAADRVAGLVRVGDPVFVRG